jgi:hypothetical protein
MKILETDDPNFECSLKVISTTKNACICYREIFYEKQKVSAHWTSLDPLKKPQPLARRLDFDNPDDPDVVPGPLHSVFLQ